MTQRFAAMGMICVLMCVAPVAQAQPSSPTSPKGAEVRMVVNGETRSSTVKGELLAVDSTHVWLLVDERATTIPRASVKNLKVRAHKYGGKRALQIGAVGAVVTGLGMSIACSSLEEETNCGAFVVGWAVVWSLMTGISALFMQSNSWDTLPLTSWSLIATHARYPQGAPPTLTSDTYQQKP